MDTSVMGMAQERWPWRLMRMAGWLLAALGTMVIVGWHAHLVVLTSVHPSFVAMQYNTALAFVLSGVGLIAFSYQHRWPVLVMGAVVAVVGGLTVLEHLANLDLGIDKALFRPYLVTGVYAPGRMAPNSALCFLLGGISLMTMGSRRALRWRSLILGLAGSAIFALGLMALLGYFLGLPDTYGWGNLTRMAVHAAVGFLVFGASISLRVFFHHLAGPASLSEIRKSIVLYAVIGTAVIAFISAILAVVPLYVRLQQGEREQLVDAVRMRAAWCAQYLDQSRTIAGQFSSRTRTRMMVESIAIGGPARDAALADLATALSEVMRVATEVIGITRLDVQDHQLVEIGEAIPPALLPQHPGQSATTEPHMVLVDGAPRMLVISPIFDELGARIGTDLVLMTPDGLAGLLASHIALKVSAQVELGRIDGEQVLVFSVDRESGRLGSRIAAHGSPEETGVRRAITHENGVITYDLATSKPMLAAFGPVSGASWAVLVSSNAGEVYGNVNQQLLLVMAAVLVLTLLGAVGIYFLVRPLTSSMIVHTDELERQIRLRTATLDAELTHRKQVAEALRLSEERFRQLSASVPIGVFQTDVAGLCLYTNQQWQYIAGLTLEESLGEGWAKAIHPEDRAKVFAAWQENVRTKTDFVGEFRFVTPHGEVRWVQSRATAMESAGQVHGYVGSVEDITTRKLAAEVVAASEAKFRSVVQSSNAGIVLSESHGRIMSWNQGAERIFGYRADEIIGQQLTRLMPERFHQLHLAGMARLDAGGEKRVVGKTVELAGLRKDGSEFPLELALSMWSTKEGSFFSGIIQDISERKRDEVALRAAKEAAEAAARAKSEFLATMSHEIRTPMNGVIGMTGLLMDTPLSEQQRAMVDTVRSCSDSLLDIINDILDFSKIEAGKMDLEEVDFNLRQVVEDAVGLLAEKAHSKHLELASVVESNVPVAVRGDPGRLRQVLVNLISNGVKFTERGEVVVRVELTGDASSGLRRALAGIPPAPGQPDAKPVVLAFSITDTGVGIMPEAQSRLFRSFSQADSSTTRKFGGTGLGLAISKRLVDLMGGDISVSSAIGVGSTFRFTARLIPRTALPSAEPAVLLGLSVLAVDDNATNREILRQQIGNWGMSCTLAEDGSGAVRALQAAARTGNPFRIAVIDMLMPGMDGLTLARAIKADEALCDTKLIMLTSLSGHGISGEAQEVGIAACLTKPIRQSHLLDALVRVVAGEADISASARRAVIALPSLRGRVLVAEDNTVNQRLAVALLNKLGCHADVVSNGVEALAALAQLPYDAVLMDCQMPELDGYEATREWRRREATRGDQRRMPVIAMTANAMEGDREQCLAAGMDDYIAKPVRIELMAEALARWLPPGDGKRPASDRLTTVTAIMKQPLLNSVEEPLVDPKLLDKLYREVGDAETVIDVANIYATEADGHVQAITDAIAAADPDALKRSAHKFKGSSQIIGAVGVATCCQRLESLGKAKDFTDANALVEAMRPALAAALAMLKAWKPPSAG